MVNYRNLWFEFVAEIRRKKSTKKKPVSHAEAMKIASELWPKRKQKLQRKALRAQKAKKVITKMVSIQENSSVEVPPIDIET